MQKFELIIYLSILFLIILLISYLFIKKLFKELSNKIACNLQQDLENGFCELIKESKLNLSESKDRLVSSSKNTLEDILKPFKEDLHKFHQSSHAIHNKQTEQFGHFQGILDYMIKEQNKLATEANKLSTALRGNVKLQGNLGEAILKRVLESSGLSQYICYKEQEIYSTEDARKQPDIVINLPQNKHVIIDSKLSLNSYVDFSNAENEIDKKNLKIDIKKSFDKHIKSLIKKDYAFIDNLDTIHAVFLFVPIEAVYLFLVENFPEIFIEASKHKIYIVSTISLMPLLQVIYHLWTIDKQNKNTVDMAKIAGKIYDKLVGVLYEFDNIRNGIHKLDSQLENMEKKFTGKRENIITSVERLKQLGASTNKCIPEVWLQKSVENHLNNQNN